MSDFSETSRRAPDGVLCKLYSLLGVFFTYRAVLLLAIALALIGFFRDSSMISGLFALNPKDQGWLSLVITLLGVQIFVCTRILQLHGSDRFGSASQKTPARAITRLHSTLRWVAAVSISVLPVAVFLYKLLTLKSEGAPWYIFLGVFSGSILFAASIGLENLTSPAGVEQVLPIGPLLRSETPRVLRKLTVSLSKVFRFFMLKLDRSGAGYVDGDRLLSGHLLAFLSTSLIAALYCAAFAVTKAPLAAHFQSVQPGQVKAIFYALLLLSLYGSAAAFLCFLLDRYRIPVLTLIALASFFVSLREHNTHYYQLRKANPQTEKVDATAIWWGQNDKVIVISAEGGGIRAAAWTTRVLKGIVDELPADLGPKFVNSVRLLSGVSGGSVGLMFYQSIYANKETNEPRPYLSRVHEAGICGDALPWISFGLAYYDVARGFPYLTYSERDRGWGAEHAWAEMLGKVGPKSDKDITLNQLRKGVAAGEQPLLVFNTTAVDTGEPVELTNFDMSPSSDYKSLNTLYRDTDLRLATAVRLSAAFPYVTPSPRPYLEGVRYPRDPQSYALIDGGLYDNFGVAGVYYTLQEALPKDEKKEWKQPPPKPILWIHIRLTNTEEDLGGNSTRTAQSLAGPLVALYNTRSSGQRSRADQLIDLARRRLGTGIAEAKFVYPVDDSPQLEKKKKTLPLNWALRDSEITDVNASWGEMKTKQESMRKICEFLDGGAACATLPAANEVVPPKSKICVGDVP